MPTEHFEKTPKKADRWFWIAIVSALLYGATFSLLSLFNWIFFCVSAYAFFMSYYLLPVQPRIFQQKRKDFFGGSTATGRGSQSSSAPTPDGAVPKGVAIIIITAVVGILFFIVIGILNAGDSEEELPANEPTNSTEEPAENLESINYISKGNDYFNTQNYDSAEISYDQALRLAPSNTEAVYGKGIVRYYTNRQGEALQYFETSYQRGFRYAWLSWVLADYYDKRGETLRAIDLYKESTNLDSAYVESYQRLAELIPHDKEKYLKLAREKASN